MAETEVFHKLPGEKKERVLRAAVNEFANKGYDDASMNSLVKEAGISKGSLFQYFSTKFDLFDSIVAVATMHAKNYIKKARDDSSEAVISARIEDLIQAGFRFIDDYPHLAKIYFRILHTGKAPFGGDKLVALHSQSIGYLKGLLDEAEERGELRCGVDTPRVAFILNGVMQQLLHAYYTAHVDSGLGLYQGDAAEKERWIRAMLDLIGNGIFSESVAISMGEEER